MQVRTREKGVLEVVANVAVEDDPIAEVGCIGAQLVFPPAGPDDVQDHAGQVADGVDGLFDALVRHEAGEDDKVSLAVGLQGGKVGGDGIDAVLDDRDVGRVHAERYQVRAGSL